MIGAICVGFQDVYRVMVDVSSALNFMHNHESGATAHGDVKMENILLFPGGHFKLCDLGAAESEDVSSTRSVMSQLYVSPERMESETGRATCSSDVWALGIVLHWLLFGEPPFKSQNAARLFREIGSFKVSMIGSSCGGEERALLMRMLDPNPTTRVTSSQLSSFGVFRCIVNTLSALWRLKDADEQALHLQTNTHQAKNQEAIKKLKIKHKQELEVEKNARTQAERKNMQMEEELRILKEKYSQLDSERIEALAKVTRLERELKDIRAMPFPPAHPTLSRQRGSPPPQRRQVTKGRSLVGAAAIELFDRAQWTVSGNVFSCRKDYGATLLSFEFGAVVVRLSFIFPNRLYSDSEIGIVSSSLSQEALTKSFVKLKGGAGWNMESLFRCTTQNDQGTHFSEACKAMKAGQRVVLEADGREGKRTLKLSQDGETAPVFFTNIPVPFRFAVRINSVKDSVEIEKVEVVSSQMVGGTIPVKMDE
ncbi:putative Protein kinase domain containing protein [Blattamonas nauphoetae]|uniref:Protein kinase domain-containing protein n=1 Tax=Blattamonas nauphoetae TaxID=2049346 RepID=A0ABQ9Y7S5_9EUKA|nr:putative Protein kinase domain containing protein [Blattamonas nauphoetae]